jgi:hypothetical protein
MKSLNKQRTLLSVSLLLSFAFPAAGLDLDARDLKVRPGDDFFNYALGAWDARTAIAADQTEAGVDVEVFDRVQSQLREIIEHSAATSKDSEVLIAALYGSFMDEARIEALDAAPLKHDLALIEASATKDQFTDIMAASYAGYGASFFSLTVAPDGKHPANVLILGQGGLGMPDRDYYLESEFRGLHSPCNEQHDGHLGGLPLIVDRECQFALRAGLRHGTDVGTALQLGKGGVDIQQPVVRQESGGAEAHADRLHAGMRIEDRMA